MQTSLPSTVVHHERVVGTGERDGRIDLHGELTDLLGCEHAAQMDVAGALEEVAHVVVAVLEREGALEVEGLAAPTEHRKRIVQLVDRLAVICGAQRRLPPREVAEATERDRDSVRIEQREARAQLPDERTPVLVREFDDGARLFAPWRDCDAVVGHRVRVRPTVLELKRQRANAFEIDTRKCAVSGRKSSGEIDQMELVEVNGTKAFTHRHT